MKREEFSLALNALLPGCDPEASEKWAEFAAECVGRLQFAYSIPMIDDDTAIEKWLDATFPSVLTIRALILENSENDSENWRNIRCNFCGKRAEDVIRMIAGPGAYICNECIDLCTVILAEEGESREKTDHAEVGEAEE